MPAHRNLLTGTVLDVVAVAALLLPWWREAGTPVQLVAGPTVALPSETWAGWEVLGAGRTSLLLALAGAAVIAAAVRRRPAWRALVAAAGLSAAAMAATAAVDRGSAAQGTGVAMLAGLAAAAVAVAAGPIAVRPVSVLAAAAVAAALIGTAVPGPAVDAARGAGPFVRVGSLAAAAFRSGTAGTLAPGPALAVVDGSAAVLTGDGMVRLDDHGRADVLARVPAGDRGRRQGIIGVAGDRVARWVDAGVVMVTGLRPGDPVAIRVRDVDAAGPVGADGSVWVHTRSDPNTTVRSLDLGAYSGAQDLAAVYLPVVTIDTPVGSAALDVDDLLPTSGTALRRADGTRIERVTPAPGRTDVSTVAGGLDPTCGLTANPRDASLSGVGPLAIAPGGALWFVTGGTRLVRLGTDDVLHAVATPAPGPVSGLVATPDGAVVLALQDSDGPALWRLPDAASALSTLPPATTGCAADPPPVGPPVGLVPIANASGDLLGVPLDTSGSWASSTRSSPGEIAVVTPDGRLPLGSRAGGDRGSVVPDGRGGAWWLEDSGTRATLVHGRPDLAPERYPAVERPAADHGTLLVPDLGGRPPLLGTADGAFRVSGGTALQVLPGRVDGGVVRADGRGWVLADGRVVALDGDRVLGPVIDAGADRTSGVPVAVQLAKGVPANRLALPRAHVGLDAGGRAVVVSDGVVLAVDDAGTVTPVAQDPRLGAPFTVVGGLVQYDDGTLSRVDLPAR